MTSLFQMHAQPLSQMQYEPELFPGLIYRMKEPKVVLLIFVSGKVVLTGNSHSGLCLLDTHLPLLPRVCACANDGMSVCLLQILMSSSEQQGLQTAGSTHASRAWPSCGVSVQVQRGARTSTWLLRTSTPC